MSFAPAGRPGAVRGRVPCQVHLFSRPSGHRGFTSERKPALSRRSSREGVDLGFCSARTFGGRIDRLFGGPGCRSNFLTDEQAAFRRVPHRSELERFFFPCNADRELMPSPSTGGSPRPCTPCAWPANRATAGRSKTQASLQEGRHTLARKIFRGRAIQLCQDCHDAMENQVGALGMVLSALVARAGRRSPRPFVRHHVNVLGRDSFQLPGLPGVCARCARLGGRGPAAGGPRSRG